MCCCLARLKRNENAHSGHSHRSELARPVRHCVHSASAQRDLAASVHKRAADANLWLASRAVALGDAGGRAAVPPEVARAEESRVACAIRLMREREVRAAGATRSHISLHHRAGGSPQMDGQLEPQSFHC